MPLNANASGRRWSFNPPTAIGSKVALPITAGTLSFYTPLTAVFIYYSERQAAGRQLTGNYPWLRRSTKVENTPERGVYKHKQMPGRETIKTSCLPTSYVWQRDRGTHCLTGSQTRNSCTFVRGSPHCSVSIQFSLY